MSKFFLFSRANHRSFAPDVKPSLFARIAGVRNMGYFLLVGILLIMGATYLIQVNANATGGFEVSQLSRKIEDLNKQNGKMDIESTTLRSLDNVQKITERKPMEKISSINYIRYEAPAVAFGAGSSHKE